MIFTTIFLTAKGVLAGSVIENVASIKYNLGNQGYSTQSNIDRFLVDRVIDVKSFWQDSSAVEVSEGEKNRVLTFVVANEGNGDDNISLSGAYDGSEFAQEDIRVFVDSNMNGVFDSNDTQTHTLKVGADENVTLFIVSNTPKSVDGNISKEALSVVSNSINSNGADEKEKVDTVIRKAKSKSVGVYKLRDYHLISKKSAKIIGGDGGLHTGSIVEYSINVKVDGGKGEFDNVVVTDNIPTNCTYLPNSIIVNGVNKSDNNDSDNATFNNNTIIVKIGKVSNINNTKNNYKISFKVQVN